MSVKAGSVASRADQQRERILNAAQQCFIDYGFHAAGMARIAQTAGMSPGLIYRYFESKNAIVLAIIERQLQEKRADISALGEEVDLRPRVAQLFDSWRERDPAVMNAALFLEMSSEASRNPDIATALAAADRTSGADFRGWLQQRARAGGAEPDDREIRVRALALGCLIEGLAVRAVREPDIEPEVLQATLDLLLPQLTTFKPA